MLHINKDQVRSSLEELCTTNGVTMSQLAGYIFRNFYEVVNPLTLARKIKYHAVAIEHLSDRI